MALYIVTIEAYVGDYLAFKDVGISAPEGATEEELYEALLQTEWRNYSPSILDWYQEY